MSEVRLADLTTIGVGGPARSLVRAATRSEIVDAVRAADAAGETVLLLGGGSNLLVSDAGVPGTVIQVASRGVTVSDEADAAGGRLVTIEAGHPWDDAVRQTVEAGLSGLESLSGIPGSAGATPVQNVGAYGSEVSQSLVRVVVFDRETQQHKELSVGDLRMGYRDSMLKRSTVNGSPRYVVLAVTFHLFEGARHQVAYQQLANALDIEVGDGADPAAVREAVLRLRASKGMVLDPQDPDTRSCGSFFTNPIVTASVAEALPPEAPRYPAGTESAEGEPQVKLSAAWLIDHAGFHKGFGTAGQPGEDLAGGRAGLSTKHALALTNRGDATASDLLAVARAVRDGVEQAWGLRLDHEPLIINDEL